MNGLRIIMKTLKLNLLIFLLIFLKLHALPKVTIITSVYKGRQFIEGFMKDITQQSIFKIKVNKIDYYCELIIIDCASPDNEIEFISPYLEIYPNITYKRLDFDPGLYGAWNYALSISSGKYITNANIDDRISTDCIEFLSKCLDSNPNIDFVYSDNYISFTPNETFEELREIIKNLSEKEIKKDYIWSASSKEFSPQALLEGGVSGNHPMWRRSIHKKAGLFDATLKVVGDWEMWLRGYLNGMKLKKMKGVHGVYFRNPKGLSSDDSNYTYINNELLVVYNLYKNKILKKIKTKKLPKPRNKNGI
jgi:hypothetical protein